MSAFAAGGEPLRVPAYAPACSPDLADGRRAVSIAEGIGAFAARDAILRHRRVTGLPNRSRAVVTAVRLGIVASPSA